MDAGRDDEHETGPDLTALERRLSAWRPAAAIDRDRLLYESGRAAARADARPWRLATAALILISMGLGGALIHQRSSLARERALLASERASRIEREARLAARSAPPTSPPPGPIEPPGPNSYLALSSRLTGAWDGEAPDDVPSQPGPRRPAPDPSGGEWHPAPLRPQDIRRVLDL